MRLANYLKKIEREEPLNLGVFKKLLEQLNLGVAHEIEHIRARKVQGDDYLIEYIPDSLALALQRYQLANSESRVSASRQNLSHRVRVSGSLLTLRTGTHHPHVVIFSRTEPWQSPVSHSRYAVVIENLENFLAIEATIAFLQDFCLTGTPTKRLVEDTDFIWGGGNQIANQLHSDYLEQYDHIDLLLDFDLGGFTIAANLLHLLPRQSIRYVLPSDIARRLAQVQSEVKQNALDRILRLADPLPQLHEAALLMKQHRRTLEQENFLDEHSG